MELAVDLVQLRFGLRTSAPALANAQYFAHGLDGFPSGAVTLRAEAMAV
jgi:hypothetical protein